MSRMTHPTAAQKHFKIDLWPEPNREDKVFGSKAVGEPPSPRNSRFERSPDAVFSISSKMRCPVSCSEQLPSRISPLA